MNFGEEAKTVPLKHCPVLHNCRSVYQKIPVSRVLRSKTDVHTTPTELTIRLSDRYGIVPGSNA